MTSSRLALVLLAACSRDPATPSPASEPRPGPSQQGTGAYYSDCSLTNPIARDPCRANEATHGLATCASLHVTVGDGCAVGASSCYVEQKCADDRVVASDFLVCAKQTPSRCLTKSSRRFKHDIAYLSRAELDDLARRIETSRVARYRYNGELGPENLGLIVEDQPDAPWVADDGQAVNVYALLAASIAALQVQDERIRALESRCFAK